MNRVIYFGPPGTGKTATLLSVLARELKQIGVEDIAFLTFTRRARREAVERVEKEMGIVLKDLPYFRTIHSAAFRALRLQDGDVLGSGALKEFGELMGMTFGEVAASELAAEGIASQSKGDVLIALSNLARLKMIPLKTAWKMARADIDWQTVDHFERSYATFKIDKGLLDFTDVLQEFINTKAALPISVYFVDEAQDLSPLQWQVVNQATAMAIRGYVAGDDDQAIYGWAGADANVLINLEGDRSVLSLSHRLPFKIYDLAHSITRQIKTRVEKKFAPRPESIGRIIRQSNAEAIAIKPGEQWLWLVRNRFLLSRLQGHLEQTGIVYSNYGRSSIVDGERDAIYTWERLRAGKTVVGKDVHSVYKQFRSRIHVAHGHKGLTSLPDHQEVMMQDLKEHHGLLVDDVWFNVMPQIPEHRRSYYRRLLRNHGSLKLNPQVQLETIHGSKGAEAPRVALFTEMARRTYEEMSMDPDSEHRVWYVGATRASEELHLVQPEGRFAYQFKGIS